MECWNEAGVWAATSEPGPVSLTYGLTTILGTGGIFTGHPPSSLPIARTQQHIAVCYKVLWLGEAGIIQLRSEDMEAQRNHTASKLSARSNAQGWTKPDAFPLPQTVHSRHKPEAHNLCNFAILCPHLKGSLLSLNLPLLWSPCSNPNSSGSLSLWTQPAGSAVALTSLWVSLPDCLPCGCHWLSQLPQWHRIIDNSRNNNNCKLLNFLF